MQGKFPIFGVPFSTSKATTLRHQVIERTMSGEPVSVVFANAHVCVEAKNSPEYLELLKKTDVVVPDGAPVAWVLRAKGQNEAERYSGPDFMEDVFKELPEGRHFFLGSSEQTLEKIRERFNKSGYRSKAVGFYSPPFTKTGFSEAEKEKQLKLIKDSRADFVWVGLGAPKQEKYVVEMSKRAGRGAWLAVGAAFDFYAGLKPRAPKVLQKFGLEWSFRLATEPRRLAKRYLTTNPVFVGMAIREIFR